MQEVVLGGVVPLRSCAACCFRRRSRLDESAGKLVGLMLGTWVGLLVGSLVGFMGGALVGLLVGSLMGTLGIGGCGCMEHMILLLSSIWVVGMLGGVCTIRTRCVLRVTSFVAVSSNLLGCAYI
jgi:hypothetical protein